MSERTVADAQRQLAAGDPQGARSTATALLAVAALPAEQRAAALWVRARASEALKDHRAAAADLEAAAAITPQEARIWNELGVLRTLAGDQARAIEAFRQAVVADPNNARAHNNLGIALRSVGDLAAAAAAFGRAIALKPDYALALANLGEVRRDLGDDAGAQATLEAALAADPKLPAALLALGALSRNRGNVDKAVVMFARAAQLDVKDPKACFALAYALAERDDTEKARQVYAEALSRDPRQLRALLGQHLTLPNVSESAEALAKARAAFSDGLTFLEQKLPSIAATLPENAVLDGLLWSNFLLAYQGGDDRELQARYAALVGKAIETGAPRWRMPLAPRPRGSRRVRVGFVSFFFRDGTAGRYFEHWITDLDPERFEVFVYHLHPGSDALFERLARRADTVRLFPRWPPFKIAPVIRDDALDALVFTELGMEAATFVLAALRLAPLQIAGWGHPVTSGHPTIDVYLSSDVMEPPDAQAHYTERLVRLPGIGTRYARPELPAPVPRSRFGLPEDAVLLLCPQSLFKIHPDNDAVFARVLAEIADAHLVLFEGRHAALTRTYLARLDRALAPHGIARERRVHVLPQCGHDDYLRINRVCDAMLDTLHWSGGNTSLDALACGLPLVTLPGRFMRGRQSAGMLRLLGVDELIASDEDDYVRIAARLASDRAWRNALSERIVAGQSRVFDDPAPVAALERFLWDATGGTPA